ncbi:hypothetical protein SAMN06265368_2876 [Cohaesibacter gelatinilyticus]|uniref:Uncharacterized protein n=1 Tax=Cohaesibacter gelatinilyticus TaxID=372072 RepID=A0A285PDG9_9HYPH|nr:hypothetical protein SAMN06265368_2876 [Cohaesibacter gelatinilyticus]
MDILVEARNKRNQDFLVGFSPGLPSSKSGDGVLGGLISAFAS